MRLFLAILVGVLFSAAPSNAQVKSAPKTDKKPKVLTYQPFNSIQSFGGYSEQVAEKETQGRRLAEVDGEFGEKDIKPALEGFRKRLLAIADMSPSNVTQAHESSTRAETLAKILEDLNAAIHSTDDLQLRYFGAQLNMIRPLRGMVWKLRPLFEHQHAKATQSAAVSALRFAAALLEGAMPVGEWEAAFEYLTTPGPNDSRATQFSRVAELQQYIEQVIIPAVHDSALLVHGVLRSELVSPLVFDHQMIFGSQSLKDGNYRYIGHGKAEIAATLASMHSTLYHLHLFSAYQMDDLMHMNEQVARLFGINGFIPFRELGVSAEDLVKKIRHNGGDQFMALDMTPAEMPQDLIKLNPDLKPQSTRGQVELALAYEELRHGVGLANKIWSKYLKDKPAQTKMLINSGVLNAFNANPAGGEASITDQQMANLHALVFGDDPSGAATVRSVITGKRVTINLKAFFLKPHRNLTDYLPTQFEAGRDEFTYVNAKGDKLRHRNYYQGRATGWDSQVWAPCLPQIATDDPKAVGDALRTLSQAYGGGWIALPVAFMVF